MNVFACLRSTRSLYDVPSASKVKKMHATLCFDAVFFQCCAQLSKVVCTFQKLRSTFKSCVQLFKSQFSKVACTFRKLLAFFLLLTLMARHTLTHTHTFACFMDGSAQYRWTVGWDTPMHIHNTDIITTTDQKLERLIGFGSKLHNTTIL